MRMGTRNTDTSQPSHHRRVKVVAAIPVLLVVRRAARHANVAECYQPLSFQARKCFTGIIVARDPPSTRHHERSRWRRSTSNRRHQLRSRDVSHGHCRCVITWNRRRHLVVRWYYAGGSQVGTVITTYQSVQFRPQTESREMRRSS